MNEKPFDPNKPCRTRNGLSVRILTEQVEGDKPLICVLSTEAGKPWGVRLYPMDGRVLGTEEHARDLVNLPEKVVRWVNVYLDKEPDGYGGQFHRTEDEANSIAGPRRIACVRVEFVI